MKTWTLVANSQSCGPARHIPHSLIRAKPSGMSASYAYSANSPAREAYSRYSAKIWRPGPRVVTTTLPTELLTTTVTVNGEKAPLFYVDSGQINAQMPWDIPGNTVASVVVTNGSSVSNAAAVYVPATGTPGIGVFGNNRATGPESGYHRKYAESRRRPKSAI